MKRIAIVFSIVVAFVAALPYLAGLITHARYLQAFEVLSALNGVHLDTLNYERGWLSSIATTHVEITDPKFINLFPDLVSFNEEEEQDEIQFTVEHKFYHGPFVYDPSDHLSKERWKVAQTIAYSAARLDDTKVKHQVSVENELARARTVINMNGSGETLIESLALDYTDPETGVKLAWAGYQSKWEYAANFLTVKGALFMPSFELSQDDERTKFTNFSFNTEQRRGPENLWFGDTKLSFATLNHTEGDRVLNFDNFNFELKNNNESKLVNYQLNASVKDMLANGGSFSNGSLSISLDKLEAKAIKEWKKFLHEVDEGKITTKHFSTLDTLLEVVPKLLQSRPELHLNYQQNTPDGLLAAKLALAVGGQKPQQLKSIIHAIEGMEGTLNVFIPKTVVKRYVEDKTKQRISLLTRDKPLPRGEYVLQVQRETQRELDQLLDRKIFVMKNNHYALDAVVKDEKLVVNGQLMDVPYL